MAAISAAPKKIPRPQLRWKNCDKNRWEYIITEKVIGCVLAKLQRGKQQNRTNPSEARAAPSHTRRRRQNPQREGGWENKNKRSAPHEQTSNTQGATGLQDSNQENKFAIPESSLQFRNQVCNHKVSCMQAIGKPIVWLPRADLTQSRIKCN